MDVTKKFPGRIDDWQPKLKQIFDFSLPQVKKNEIAAEPTELSQQPLIKLTCTFVTIIHTCTCTALCSFVDGGTSSGVNRAHSTNAVRHTTMNFDH